MKIIDILKKLSKAPQHHPVFFDFCECVPSQIINANLGAELAIDWKQKPTMWPASVRVIINEIETGIALNNKLSGKNSLHEFLFVGNTRRFRTIVNDVEITESCVIFHTLALHHSIKPITIIDKLIANFNTNKIPA